MPERQRQTVRATTLAHQRALIPSSFMDFPLQRLVATIIFGTLQTIKIFYAFRTYTATYPEQYNGILLWWWFLDATFIFVLYVFRIPWLQFSSLKSILLVIFLSTIDVLIFVGPQFLFGGGLIKLLLGESLGKQLSVSRAKMIDIKDVIFDPTHILGKHTVHILPYGTAKLNPNDEYFCLSSNEVGKTDIYIPIVLNNTIPKSISVSRYDFDSQRTNKHSYSEDKIQRATEIGQGRQGLEYYYIRVNKPGAYSLDKIISKDGAHVRLYSRNAFVFTCPMARLQASGYSDYCKGDKDSVQLDVTGVPPLKVEYTRRIGSSVSDLKLDHIQPTAPSFDSPLTRFTAGLQDADPSFFTPSYHTNYDWASRQLLSIQLNLTFDQTQQYEYQLKRVVDGAGNVVDLSSLPKQVFTVHGPPSIQFTCNVKDPVKLLIGQDSVGAPIQLKGSGPYSVSYEYVSDDATMDTKKVETKQITIKNDGTSTLEVKSPGEYRLISISDQFCKGDVLFPSTCQVIQPPLPSVKLQHTPIPSECSSGSEIGMRFVADFQGAPPYTLKYSVIKNHGRRKQTVDRQISTDRSRHIFTYLPTSSGDYTYEFKTLIDGHYTKDPKIPPIKQTVHPQPDAKFDEKLTSKRTCLGEEMNLSVNLAGAAPFTLVWAYDKQEHSEVVTGDHYDISLPPFETAGRHIVSLIKIEDANGCSKELDSRDVVIDVRRDRPMAFFYSENKQDKTVYIAEGETTNLPLRLTGEGPWEITYRHINGKNDNTYTKSFVDPNSDLTVNKVGRYELLTVTDSICKGDALRPDYIVQWMERPALIIPEDQATLLANDVYERPAICQHVDDTINVKFTGHGPFTCAYDTFRRDLTVSSSMFSRRDNGIKLDPQEMTTGLTSTRIPLRTDVAGKYKYVFNKLSDQRYQHPFTPSPLVQLEQTVHASPTVKFSGKPATVSSPRMMCVGETLTSAEDPIWVEATGQAPFTVSVRVSQQDSKDYIVLKDIENSRFALDLPGVLEVSGKYYVELIRIQDANGCSSDVDGLPNTMMVIDALGIATITPLDACGEVCVGDQLEYSLSGEGPFTIAYEFNGRQEKVKSPTTKLSMIADKPGNLTILSVGNQRNKCQSFPKQLRSEIHQVPSSLVSGGHDIIESIQDGDMVQAVVDLVGTPPFDFEWQRSELVWDHARKHHYKGRVLESHVVHGVNEYQYHINTSIEGVIEVVSIKDRYCQYPRA
ncbi:uncharacterized protein BX664DRAFT_319225 [Halteromyces radiatus]|uniref:uncharacterized protein n=1 Tax=Halteromyces radiatus TaxID=101107 RepID=UPI0022211CE8|nr:uncharacterized protein BX664DRAFT_319225 [Halteromyces radiatus]KAI8098635.1 hypothetical protein BX664DRAFT_319225 [Halteromyces radiatus]